jgi:hypothetical protein
MTDAFLPESMVRATTAKASPMLSQVPNPTPEGAFPINMAFHHRSDRKLSVNRLLRATKRDRQHNLSSNG